MTRLAWLNGVYLSAEEVRISPFDRGFLFADGVYEVTAVVGGRLVDFERHMARLQRSLRELDYPVFPDPAELEAMHLRLVADNGISEGLVYLQVTRGAYGLRDFLPPAPDATRLTVFAYAESKSLIDTPGARDGIAVISAPDIRWGRCDIKTTQLLAASLAKHAARQQGAQDAWMVEPDGMVTEGASSNAWIVTPDGQIATRALSRDLLPGVTRHSLMDVAADAQVKITERTFSLEEANGAAEAFITGAGALIVPVVQIDGRPVGNGRPGPVTRKLQRLYLDSIGARVPDWA
jgi:D-alanine transaminase